jgi:hypothetical protein
MTQPSAARGEPHMTVFDEADSEVIHFVTA